MLCAAASAAVAAGGVLLLLRVAFSLRSILYLLARLHHWLDDIAHPHQTFTIPRFAGNDGGAGGGGGGNRQENPLFRKASLYLSTLPSVEDADGAAILSSGRKPHDILLRPLPAHPIHDSFLSARLSWTSHTSHLSLRLRRQDRRRVLRPYLQHLESLADDVDLRRRDLRLFTPQSPSLWKSSPFTHPATLDSIAMDPDLKSRLRSDLDSFLKSRTYYHRLGRVWRRSYLLHGPPGTGKSSFVSAMAKFLAFDTYYLNLTGESDLQTLLLQTTTRSLILVEDLDRYLAGGDHPERATEMLNLMDGVFSCCGEERVMVFTMSGGGGGEGVDAAAMRPGRIDVHVRFPMCDFAAFKTMAGSYLGLKDHKLYPQVEEGFQSGAAISPAEVGEIMIANRGSPSRAIKTVISALQRSSSSSSTGIGRSGSVGGGGGGSMAEIVTAEGCGVGGGLGFGKDATIREFRKLYGLIKMRGGSRKEGVMPLEVAAAQAAAAAAAANGGGGAAAAPLPPQRRLEWE